MEDILLVKKCKECGSCITLMSSCRGEDNQVLNNDYLVERCLICGQHPITEIARLDPNQTELETLGGPIVNLRVKDKK